MRRCARCNARYNPEANDVSPRYRYCARCLSAFRLHLEEVRRKYWAGRAAEAEPFRSVEELIEAGRRRGWAVIA